MPLDDTLAERLYIAWRERMEFVAPLKLEPYVVGGYRSAPNPARPKWLALTAQERSVWLHVAEVVRHAA